MHAQPASLVSFRTAWAALHEIMSWPHFMWLRLPNCLPPTWSWCMDRMHGGGEWCAARMLYITQLTLAPYRWQVPWGAGTVVGGMVLWLVSFAVVGFIVVPAGYKVWRCYSSYPVTLYHTTDSTITPVGY